ncbi:centrosomal protein CEP57L1 [Austrofundulus limnaeus]|uniref:Centrosomal protein 57kDa-like protein 1 n=1 Tax=Austrofundulus limnaeus TaxID=52670 RepID=A0A2I4BCK1_AUSLI|nr:PREDICTED: centrosomal protein CEP57L1 [Austrofundulus limnaeus]
METQNEQNLDSPSKNSYVGSYYQPPDRISLVSRQLEFPAQSSSNVDQTASLLSQTARNIDSKAVVDALKTLQEKIKRLELERKQAENSYLQFSRDAQKHQQVAASASASLSGTDDSARKELDLKLQTAEARCKVLEKQLDYMRKMVENVKKERNVLMESEVALHSKQKGSSNSQIQREKLERLEAEYFKLSRTQTLAETKLAILEQKLLKEEHERKLVQEKAEELQRELDSNLRMVVPLTEEMKPKKKTKKTKSLKQSELPSGSLRHTRMPFIAGTSTSPSHSVHANVQSVLHMMKHHQPQLCERVGALHRSGCGAKKSLQKDFSASSPASQQPVSPSADQSLSLLSDLLLALQDELGQMSFEHQELEHQIEAAQEKQQKKDLQRELERLVARMAEKEAQITKLRKHQETVHKLTRSVSREEEHTATKPSGIKPPIKLKKKLRKGTVPQNNLQLLRETQKFRNHLKQDDISWET